MELMLIVELLKQLETLNVKLLPRHAVTRIEELERVGFKVDAGVGGTLLKQFGSSQIK